MASSVEEMPATATVIALDHIDNTRTVVLESASQLQTKRNRTRFSCTHCRHAKLKCDRKKPCLQCVKKRRASSCTFPTPVTHSRPVVSIRDRLTHLETLVKGAMTRRPSNEHGNSATNSHISPPDFLSQLQNPNGIGGTYVETPIHKEVIASNHSGHVVLGRNDTTYVGATHWAAILDDIEEVRSYFKEVEEDDSPRDKGVKPHLPLIFNSKSPATKEELLAALPERSIVNRLIYRYFNSSSPALHIIHKPTFQRHYKKFWDDPHGASVSFLALIYSIMGLATFAALGAGEDNADTRGTPMEIIQIYRGCSAQCLVLADYAQPGPYTLETFLVYIEGEFILSNDDQLNCYLVVGVAVRLALRMGFHRDSDNVRGSITPFQGEFRRRIWHLLVQMDLMVSFHIGLPSMVQAVKSDTRVPLNLQDQDFDEDTIELPPSRPETEITGMSYTLAKGRIARSFSKVVEQANLLAFPHYSEVITLDRELHQAFAAIPPMLRVIPIELLITDSPQLIIQRFSLAVLFHKSRCVLHRKYLMKEKEHVEFAYSKKAGIDASMQLLLIQSEAHEATQPGGSLCKDKWFISSLPMHDLLLAAMIVYLSLVQESEGIALSTRVLQIPNTQQSESIRALERSYKIWAETTSQSVDTKKASDVLGTMVRRIKSIFRGFSRDETISTGANDALRYNYLALQSGLSFNEQSPSTVISTGVMDPFDEGQYQGLDDTNMSSDLAMQFDLEAISMSTDSLSAMIDTTMSNFDWEVFDNNVREPQVNDRAWPDLSFQDLHFEESYNNSI